MRTNNKILTERPAPKLSFLSLAARAEGTRSSREAAETCLVEEVSEIPETEPGVPLGPAADAALVIGSATLCSRGLPPIKDVVR